MQFTTSRQKNFDQYWQTVSNKKSFVFSVAACYSAHIALGEIPGIIGKDTLAFELGSDNNKNTTLYRISDGYVFSTMATPNILSCSQTMDYWVSWEGSLSVGIGPYSGHHSKLVTGLPRGYEVNAISISTEGHQGDWEFHQAKGNYYI